MKDLHSRLFELILRFNRRLTFIIGRLAPPLTLNESHTLGEIGRRQLVTAAEIGRNLVLEKSIVSRLLASLEKRGLITSESSPADGRLKYLKLTASGRELFEEDDKLRSEQVRLCVAALSAYEQADLAYLLNVMADAFQASGVPLQPSDHPLKIQIRRLTRAMGFLGNDLLGTGFSVQKCQILCLMNENPPGLSMAALKEQVPYESSMLSRLVSSLHAAKLICKHSAAGDRRRVDISLSTEGKNLWRRKSTLAGEKIIESLSAEKPEQIEHFATLLDKFLGGKRLLAGIHGENYVDVRLLNSDEQMRIGRAFLVQELVRNGLHGNLPERILSRQSLCLAAFRGDEMKSVLELGKLKGQWRILNFALASDAAQTDLAVKLLANGFDALFMRRSAERIFVDADTPAAQWLDRFADKTKIEEGWCVTSGRLRNSGAMQFVS